MREQMSHRSPDQRLIRQCLLNSLESVVQTVCGRNIPVPMAIRLQRHVDACTIEARGLARDQSETLDEFAIYRLFDQMAAEENEFTSELFKLERRHLKLTTDEIDTRLERGDLIIVAYGGHLAHIIAYDEDHYWSISDGHLVNKSEIRHLAPEYMSFNAIVFNRITIIPR